MAFLFHIDSDFGHEISLGQEDSSKESKQRLDKGPHTGDFPSWISALRSSCCKEVWGENDQAKTKRLSPVSCKGEPRLQPIGQLSIIVQVSLRESSRTA